MARMHRYGWLVCAAGALVLAGCQTGTGSRLGQSSGINNPRSSALAKQSTPPNPNFPTTGSPGSPGSPSSFNNPGFNTTTNSAVPPNPNFPSGPSNFASPNGISPVGASNNPPPGPGFATGNRSNVTVTQPATPTPAPQFSAPGLAPIAPPQLPSPPMNP